MTTRLVVLGLALALVGCDRYRTRSQGPFGRKPGGNPTAAMNPTPAPPRSQLAINGPAPGYAQNPTPPAAPDEIPLVPPRQPTAVVPAGNPVAESPEAVRPAGGVAPNVPFTPGPNTVADADPTGTRRRFPRREPDPAALPSPLAPPSNPTANAPGSPANDNLAQLKRLLNAASARWQTIDTYEATFTRREQVGTKPPAQEEVVFQFRKEPFSVYMRNVGKVGNGREVLYNPKQHKELIYCMVGQGDHPLAPAGFKAPPVSPDDKQVASRSRHSIRQAGFGNSIARFAALVGDLEMGKIKTGDLRYVGPARREEFPNTPLELVTRLIRPGEDPTLPNGGLRQLYFDARPDSPSAGLPVLVTLTDGAQKELEYYCFTNVRAPAGLTDYDFSPDRLGKKK